MVSCRFLTICSLFSINNCLRFSITSGLLNGCSTPYFFNHVFLAFSFDSLLFFLIFALCIAIGVCHTFLTPYLRKQVSCRFLTICSLFSINNCLRFSITSGLLNGCSTPYFFNHVFLAFSLVL